MRILKELWGTYHSKEVYLYTMTSSRGSTVKLTNYGARVVAIRVPDKVGCYDDVVLGFDSLAAYVDDDNYIGATIGRFANRISNASFSLDERTWVLDANDGPNTNHSGVVGFDHQVFDITEPTAEVRLKGKECNNNEDDSVVFFLTDPHNNGGFPGNLSLRITYRWAENLDQLRITYEACSDRKGILNLTNHSYFNLSGTKQQTDGSSGCNCLWHKLEITADSFLETGPGYIPTGRKIGVSKNEVTGLLKDVCVAVGRKIEKVKVMAQLPEPASAGPVALKASLSAENADEAFSGLNTCFELNPIEKPVACRLSCDKTGRELLIETSYPGLIVYTGDNLQSQSCGNHGRRYAPFDGVALECQYYPDSPNQPGFPLAIIEPDTPYLESITYTFLTRKTEVQT